MPKNNNAKLTKKQIESLSQKRSGQALSMQLKNTLDELIHSFSPEEYAKRPGKDFTRNRKLPFGELIKFLIYREGGTINKNLIDCFTPENRISASGLIQQENKLLPDITEKLFRKFNDATKSLDTKTRDGYHIYAVDGSDINLAYDPSAESYMPTKQAFGYPAKGYNAVHLNAIFDLANQTYKDCIVTRNSRAGERDPFISMIEDYPFPEDTIIVADRGYVSFNIYEHIFRRPGLDFVIRIRTNEYRELRSLPQDEWDKDFTMNLSTRQTNEDKKGFADGTLHYVHGRTGKQKGTNYSYWDYDDRYTQHLRIVRLNIGTSFNPEYETVVTSLDRFRFPASKIKELYNMRWAIETSFLKLKYFIGLKHLHTRHEDFALLEIFANLLAYNFCSRIVASVSVIQSPSRKYNYEINYKDASHLLKNFLRRGNVPPPVPIEEEMIRFLHPIRPGRKDKRKLKKQVFTPFVWRVA